MTISIWLYLDVVCGINATCTLRSTYTIIYVIQSQKRDWWLVERGATVYFVLVTL